MKKIVAERQEQEKPQPVIIKTKEFTESEKGILELPSYELDVAWLSGKNPVPKLPPVAAWNNKPSTDELESNLLTSVSHFH